MCTRKFENIVLESQYKWYRQKENRKQYFM